MGNNETNEKWTICQDTICQGYSPIMGDDKPVEYDTEAQAQAEIDDDPEFYEDCFPCKMSDIGHKIIYFGSNE